VSILEVFPKLFNRKWWLTTLFVIAGVAVLIKLGFWQLDRLAQKRAFNAHVAAVWKQEPFDLDANQLPNDLEQLEYRRVKVEGQFDYAHQIILANQSYGDAPGSIVVTPLQMPDGRTILVARGWLPTGEDDPSRISQYNDPVDASIIGLIQKSQMLPNGKPPTPPQTAQTKWYELNIDAIQPQMPYKLQPAFILQLPEENRKSSQLPVRSEPLTLDEGEHFSYAIQWYSFSLILGVGYLFFIRTHEMRGRRLRGELPDDVAHTGEPSGEDTDAEVEGATVSPTITHSEGRA
jgi:surfeit locus 1 family protein